MNFCFCLCICFALYKQEDTINQTQELKHQNTIKAYSANVIIQPEKEKEYQISDNFFIKVKILNIDDDILNYTFSINNSESFTVTVMMCVVYKNK